MRNIIKLFFIFVLIGITGLSFPVYAEDAPSTEQTTDLPGEAWSGEIPEAPSDHSDAPAETPAEAPTQPAQPAQPAEAAQPVAPSVQPYIPATTSVSETHEAEIADEETPSESDPESDSKDGAAADSEESSDEISSVETPEDDFTVLIPETARPHTVQKIRLMAFLSTSIVFFTAAFAFLLVSISKAAKTDEPTQSTKNQKFTKKSQKKPIKFSQNRQLRNLKKKTKNAKDVNPLLLPPSH